jgi:HPt (histidine-containing phosphotransfer) domain-containing protein
MEGQRGGSHPIHLKGARALKDLLIISAISVSESRTPRIESRVESPVDFASVLETVEGDKAFLAELAELVQAFAHDPRKRLAEMREAITMGEDKRLERAAHSLRGEVGLFGATMAYNLAATLEAMGQEGRLGSALRVLQALEREVEQVILCCDHAGWETRV